MICEVIHCAFLSLSLSHCLSWMSILECVTVNFLSVPSFSSFSPLCLLSMPLDTNPPPLHPQGIPYQPTIQRFIMTLCLILGGSMCNFHHHHHQFLNREGHWGTTDDFATSFLHFSLFSTALWDLPNSRPVHSLMLSSHLFLCPPCLLPPFTVPCKMVFARPDERETWPYHCSLRLFMIIRRSSCGPIACWILARTSSLVTWSSYEMCSILG